MKFREIIDSLQVKKHEIDEENKGQQGFTLLEMMMVIVISLLMMAGVFGLVSMAMGNSKVKDAQQNISTIRMGVQNLYSGQPNYSGLSNTIAENAGIFPDKLIKSAGTIKNAWNGDVTIAPNSDPSKFDVTYKSVPQEACMKLAVLSGFDEITVGGTGVNDIAGASSECASGGNDLVFVSQ